MRLISQEQSTSPETAPDGAPDVAPPVVIDVLINRKSGTVLALGEAAVAQGLNEALGSRLGTLQFIEGGEIEGAVNSWTAAQAARTGEKRGLILGGGDGSVLTAAGAFLGREDITLGVLPLGTHNLFARQLGFAADFKVAAAQYKNIGAGAVDVGQVNGRNFLVGLMIDENCVNGFTAREDLRRGRMITGLSKIFATVSRVLFGRQQALDVSGSVQKGRVFMVTNNRVTPRSNENLAWARSSIKPAIENIFAKDRQDDGTLALYSFKGGLTAVPPLLKEVLKGDWTIAPAVSVKAAPELIIRPAAKGAPRQTQIVLDGEVTPAEFPLQVKLLPKALKVYKPL